MPPFDLGVMSTGGVARISLPPGLDRPQSPAEFLQILGLLDCEGLIRCQIITSTVGGRPNSSLVLSRYVNHSKGLQEKKENQLCMLGASSPGNESAFQSRGLCLDHRRWERKVELYVRDQKDPGRSL